MDLTSVVRLTESEVRESVSQRQLCLVGKPMRFPVFVTQSDVCDRITFWWGKAAAMLVFFCVNLLKNLSAAKLFIREISFARR